MTLRAEPLASSGAHLAERPVNLCVRNPDRENQLEDGFRCRTNVEHKRDPMALEPRRWTVLACPLDVPTTPR